MNILIDSIRADGEYRALLETVKKNFTGKPLPALAGGLCTGAADALCLALTEDSSSVRTTPVLIICADEKECLRVKNTYARFGLRTAFYNNF